MDIAKQRIARLAEGCDAPAREDLCALLALNAPDDIEALRSAAEAMLLSRCGPRVYLRGLVEFSNICRCNCRYCGIRRGRRDLERYTLAMDEILDAARFCVEAGYGSMVLQSGERRDASFVAFVAEALREIKRVTRSPELPAGLGITLSVGEQSRKTYERFFEAGAHRYLLRIETSNAELFRRIHPASQSFDARVKCLDALRDIGYQVGTGVMIGLPGQTLDMLADDILFFRERDVDMIGMGPYLRHSATPLGAQPTPGAAVDGALLDLTLRTIAVTRLVLRNVNMASTTALQTLREDGRELGLRFGANVVMPNVTPTRYRGSYLLYEGKACVQDEARKCRTCLLARIRSTGREVGLGVWGDSPHARTDPLRGGR